MGNIIKIAVACACFSRIPVAVNKGTAIIPPPPPNKLFAPPTKPPKPTLLMVVIICFCKANSFICAQIYQKIP